jgi:hypothetical protein
MISTSMPGHAESAPPFGHGSVLLALPIPGAPISLEQHEEHYLGTGAGAQMSVFTVTGTVHRDSAGRLIRLSETKDVSGHVTGALGIILDLAAGRQTVLMPTMRTAVHMVLPQKREIRFASTVFLDPGREWKTTTEQIGKRVIEGIEFVGSRVTHTAIDDDGLADATEEWFCDELKLIGAIAVTRPHERYTVSIHNLRRQEPDPDLFNVPADYTIAEPQ